MMHYLLPHIFLKTINAYKTKTALIIGDETYSYWSVYEDSLRLVQHMSLTIEKNAGRVIILGANTYATVIAFWATVLSGMVPCLIDHEVNEQTLSEIIKNINPKMVVFDNITDAQFNCIVSFEVPYISELCERIRIDLDFYDLKYISTESDLAIIMHTSGSTGIPKGVMLSHRNVLAAIESISSYLTLNSSDVILSVLPMHFDYGLYQMLLAFNCGATLVLEKNLLFPNLVANKISRHCVSILPCVPLMVQLFHITSKRYAYDFSSLRLVTNTGENITLTHIEKIYKIFPKAKLISMYGLTECKRCSYVPHSMLNKKTGSIGIPMPNLKMWIQDSNGKLLGKHIEGNLVISGPTVMMGYWNDPIETAKKITTDEYGQKVLLSGDRAVMDEDGYFYFKGRNDFIVKYKGAKLNTYEYIEKLSHVSHINRTYIFINKNEPDDQKLV